MQALSEILALIKQYYGEFEKILFALSGLLGAFGSVNTYIMYMRGNDRKAKEALVNVVIGVMVIVFGTMILRRLINGSL
jgi:hypothetical protein